MNLCLQNDFLEKLSGVLFQNLWHIFPYLSLFEHCICINGVIFIKVLAPWFCYLLSIFGVGVFVMRKERTCWVEEIRTVDIINWVIHLVSLSCVIQIWAIVFHFIYGYSVFINQFQSNSKILFPFTSCVECPSDYAHVYLPLLQEVRNWNIVGL